MNQHNWRCSGKLLGDFLGKLIPSYHLTLSKARHIIIAKGVCLSRARRAVEDRVERRHWSTSIGNLIVYAY